MCNVVRHKLVPLEFLKMMFCPVTLSSYHCKDFRYCFLFDGFEYLIQRIVKVRLNKVLLGLKYLYCVSLHLYMYSLVFKYSPNCITSLTTIIQEQYERHYFTSDSYI